MPLPEMVIVCAANTLASTAAAVPDKCAWDKVVAAVAAVGAKVLLPMAFAAELPILKLMV